MSEAKKDDSELSSLLAAMGFSVCDFEPDECDRCHKLAPLYFGNQDYWDSREGDYHCENCLRINLQKGMVTIDGK